MINPYRTPGNWITQVTGNVLKDPVQQNVDTRNGSKNVTNLLIETEDGVIRVAFWEDLSYEALEFKKGDRIKCSDLQTREPYRDTYQASNTSYTKIGKI
ncbi:MAG: hypothetical protein ACTSW1_17825 [Candidatus Hodarchaeales archaeon]